MVFLFMTVIVFAQRGYVFYDGTNDNRSTQYGVRPNL
jgi:hypothetical protein